MPYESKETESRTRREVDCSAEGEIYDRHYRGLFLGKMKEV